MKYLVTNSDLKRNDNYKIISVEESLEKLNGINVIGFDTETTGLEYHKDKIILLQFGTKDFQIIIDTLTVDLLHYKTILEDKSIIKIGANLKFDYQFCLKNNIVCQNLYDVLLAEYVLNNGISVNDLREVYDKYIKNEGITDKKELQNINNKVRFGYYSLFSLVYKYFTIALNKSVRDHITEGLTEAVLDYSALDVKYLNEIREIQLAKARQEGCTKAISLENNFIPVLAYTEYCGIKLDKHKWLDQYNTKIKEQEETLNILNNWIIENKVNKFISMQIDMFEPEKSKVTMNWNSDKNVHYIFNNVLGFELLDKNGKNTTEAKVIQKYIDKHELVSIYLKYASLKKDTSTYGINFLKNINSVTNRIHPNFKQLVDTGRLSCNAPNLQNIPATHEYRTCFIAENGNRLIDSDYTGQESIILVNYSMDKSLLEFYDKDLGDLHSYVAKLTFPDELEGIEICDIKAKRKDLRQQAKSVEFAIGYGGNAFTIMNNIGISKENAERIYDNYFKAFPDLKVYFKKNGDFSKQNGYVLISEITGRKYYFPFFKEYKDLRDLIKSPDFWTPENKEIYYYEIKQFWKYDGIIQRTSQNFNIQGSSAETIKIAAYFLYNWILENNYLHIIKVVNLVHDEILIECPTNLVEITKEKVKECMERSGNIYCKRVPLLAEPEDADYWIH